MTQAILLTAASPGAIAVILVAGPTARATLTQLAPAIAALQPGQTRLLTLTHAGAVLDQALIVCLPAPETERFELHLHGGPAVVSGVRSALCDLGATVLDPAGPEAATLAVPTGSSTIATEVLAALPRAQTPTAVALLANQSTAGLTAWAKHWQAQLANTASSSILNPQSPIPNPPPLWPLHSATQWLLDRSAALAHLLDLPRIALIGPPNAGKSTLANALLGRSMAITSHLPGTTRDWVDALTVLVGGNSPAPPSAGSMRVPSAAGAMEPRASASGSSAQTAALPRMAVEVAATLVDTAGLRATSDPIETESIARSHAQARQADALVVVLDAVAPRDLSFLRPLLAAPDIPPLVIALNKTDLLPDATALVALPLLAAYPIIPISALEHRGLESLQHYLLAALGLAEVSRAEPFAFTPRQLTVLRQIAGTDTAAHAQRLLHELQTPAC